jgi:SAM-dependent methyltransferase
MESMMLRADKPHALEAAFAQPLTEELLSCAGITPGMRVLVLGSGLTEIALLVAERVGCNGRVIAAHADALVVGEAAQRALREGFDRVVFSAASPGEIALDQSVDAVVGRFFLMHELDPVSSIRHLASMVRDGGRIVVQEWHYASTLWAHTSSWPPQPLYQDFARWSIEGLRHRRAHADMGLRLVNVFTEAGLAPPVLRTDLRVIHGPDSLGYAFFEAAIRELAPALDCSGFAARLERDTVASAGHVFLPLQVGAFARVTPNS